MSERRAGGIFASSFVAGSLVAAAMYAPSAWEPIPGPYFGLDEPAAQRQPDTAVPDAGIEAAHAELSARAQNSQSPDRAAAASRRPPRPSPESVADPRTVPMPLVEATVAAAGGSQQPAAQAFETRATMPSAADVDQAGSFPPPIESVEQPCPPPERVALADAAAPAAAAALAQTLPGDRAQAGVPAVIRSIVPDASPAVDVNAASGDAVAAARTEEPPESLKAMIVRRQAAHAAVPAIAEPAAASAVETLVVPDEDAAAEPTVPAVRSWSQVLADARPADAPPRSGVDDARPVARPRTLGVASTTGSLGAAPLPGGPWTDPDAVNWSEIPTTSPADEAARRRAWLGERAVENRADEVGGQKREMKGPLSGRFLDRLRGVGPRLARLPDAAAEAGAAEVAAPDIGRWPRPSRLEQQCEHLAALAAAAPRPGEPLAGWVEQVRVALGAVLETRGPRDVAADASLVALGEHVVSGMSLADSSADAAVASHTRRAALAVARRVAVWRASATLCGEIQRNRDAAAADAAGAMTHQAAGRASAEVARLLDAIERFEADPSASDALVVRTALGSIGGFYPTASHSLLRAVEDHYVAPNVRITVHQQFMEKLMPGATVDTAPFQDVVMGREVRGTRRVERTTTLRLVPDDDEICFNLEVHGDIASRSTTESGPVSVSARSASAFTVRKPIKISSQGLLFGNAAGVASNRSRVDNIQTSFDAMPMMGSLVRSIAKNQQAEAMPEANREVIDKIVSRACREVDSQSEPQLAEMAERVRERVWMPLVNLGLEPKAVAMETSSTLATMRLRLAATTQLAAHTPRPRGPLDAMLSMQVHESSVNNVVDRLGLAGRRLELEELIRMVCAKVGVEPSIPDDLPEGVAVEFAEVQPLRVECRDGLVHVRVKLDAIESGRRDWTDIVAHVAYRPVCNGPQVLLERDGPIRLSGPGQEGRMELALRTIFGKIFPKERPIALLPEKIVANPRLTGVQAVQAIGSDGWLALALQQVSVAKPADPTAEQRAAEVRRKIIFR